MSLARELDHPFFYVEESHPGKIFSDENRYFLQEEDGDEPWNHFSEKNMKELFIEWQSLEEKMKEIFSERKNNNDKKKMIVFGVALFLKFLFWTNQKPVQLSSLDKQIALLEDKPFNIQERLQFIIDHPLLHHSFVQLSELFIEQKKIYYKKLAIEKYKGKK